jgi:hypothetical protein
MILAAYLVTGFGVASVYAVALLRGRLFDGPTGRALPLVIASAVFGLVSLWLLLRRQFVAVRVTAALAVVAIIWGWRPPSTRTCWSRTSRSSRPPPGGPP